MLVVFNLCFPNINIHLKNINLSFSITWLFGDEECFILTLVQWWVFHILHWTCKFFHYGLVSFLCGAILVNVNEINKNLWNHSWAHWEFITAECPKLGIPGARHPRFHYFIVDDVLDVILHLRPVLNCKLLTIEVILSSFVVIFVGDERGELLAYTQI